MLTLNIISRFDLIPHQMNRKALKRGFEFNIIVVGKFFVYILNITRNNYTIPLLIMFNIHA